MATVEGTDDSFPGNFLVCDLYIQKYIHIFLTLFNL